MDVNAVDEIPGETEASVAETEAATEQPWAATLLMPQGPSSFDGVLPEGWSVRQALFGPVEGSSRAALEKRLLDSPGASVRENSSLGVAFKPFNMHVAAIMEDLSPHHASCIGTLVDMTVGLGLIDEEVYDVLDPLTLDGFDALLRELAQDIYVLGTGYLEDVRDPSSREITGLHSLPCVDTHVVLDGRKSGDFHFMYSPSCMRVAPRGTSFEYDFAGYADQAMFARFGDADRLAETQGTERMIDAEILRHRRERIIRGAIPFVDYGEAIQFKLPTSRWRHYGKPGWLGAQPYLDLSCAHLQRTSDYMRNRGTPDHLLSIIGTNLNTEAKASLQACMSAGKGRNFGRSAALVLPSNNSHVKVQLDKFSDGVDGLSFRELHDATALAICSAHRVPPILAGISVPRPMGSANELVQAIVLTQLTVVESVQRMIEKTLGRTLGKRGKGIRGLKPDSFGLRNLIEHTDIAALDTLARQKDTGTLDRSPQEGLRR